MKEVNERGTHAARVKRSAKVVMEGDDAKMTFGPEVMKGLQALKEAIAGKKV